MTFLRALGLLLLTLVGLEMFVVDTVTLLAFYFLAIYVCSLLGEEIKTEGSRSGATNGVGIVVASNHFLFSLPPPPPGAQQFLFFFFFFFNSCCYPNFLLLDCCVPHPDHLQHVPLVNKKNYTTQKKKKSQV